MTSLKTVFVSFYESYPPVCGAAVVTYNTAKYFLGTSNHLIQFGHGRPMREKVGNLNIYNLSIHSGRFIWKALNLAVRYPNVLREIRRIGPDLLVMEGASWALYYLALFIFLRLGRFKGRIVYHSHNVEYLLRRGKNNLFIAVLTRWAERSVMRGVNDVTAVSTEDAARIRDLYGVDCLLLPNGVDTEMFDSPSVNQVKEIRTKYGIPDKTVLFMGMSDYPPNKEAIRFLVDEVFPPLLARIPDAKLVLLGDIVDIKRTWIINPGKIPFEDVPSVVKCCDVCAAPIFSGSGTRVKILEYMAAGRPVIATEKGMEGLDVLPGRDIFVAEKGRAFASCIEDLFLHADKAKRVAEAGRETVRRRYSWKTIMKDLSRQLDMECPESLNTIIRSEKKKKRMVIYAAGIGPVNRGIGQYASHLLPELLPLLVEKGWAVDVILSKDGKCPVSLPGIRCRHLPIERDRTVRRFFCEQIRIPLSVRGADAFVSLESVFPLTPVPARRRFAVIHDIHVIRHVADPESFPEDYTKQYKLWAVPTTRRAVRSSHHLIAVSGFTKREVIDYYGIPEKKISVVHNGVDLNRFHSNWDERILQEIKEKYHLPPSFYLFVGPFSRKKNLAHIINTYTQFSETNGAALPVVVAGDPRRNDLYCQTMAGLKASGRENLFHFIGFVPDDDLPPLTAAARALIYPSLYEGFGLPVLEAMASGTPVIAASSSSIPEVAGDAAILFDPINTDSLAAALKKLIEIGCVEHLRKKGLDRCRLFTWKKSAERLAAVITGEMGHEDKTL